jgi:hypothetical protein
MIVSYVGHINIVGMPQVQHQACMGQSLHLKHKFAEEKISKEACKLFDKISHEKLGKFPINLGKLSSGVKIPNFNL